jgi:hypothetical protein
MALVCVCVSADIAWEENECKDKIMKSNQYNCNLPKNIFITVVSGKIIPESDFKLW